MRVIARFRLTGLLVTWFFTERGPVLRKLVYLYEKMGIYLLYWLVALMGLLAKLYRNGLTGWDYFCLYSIYIAIRYKMHILTITGIVYCSMPCVYMWYYTYVCGIVSLLV